MGGVGSGGNGKKPPEQRRIEGRRLHPETSNVVPFGRVPRKKPPVQLSADEQAAWRLILANIPRGARVDPIVIESYARAVVRLRSLGSLPSPTPAEIRLTIQLTEITRKLSAEIRTSVERSTRPGSRADEPDHMAQLLTTLDSPRYRRDLEAARQAREAGWNGDVDDLNDFVERSGFKPDLRGLPKK